MKCLTLVVKHQIKCISNEPNGGAAWRTAVSLSPVHKSPVSDDALCGIHLKSNSSKNAVKK